MRSAQPLVQQPAAWDFGTAPAGPAMTALGSVIVRIAVVLRGIALAEMVAQVIIWHSFYWASPWRCWGPALALAWGGAAIAYLRRHRPRWQLVCADTAVYATLAAGAAWCVPAAIRGEAGSWLFIVTTSQFVVPIWFAPRVLSLPLTFAPCAAFAVGTTLAPAAHLGTANPRKASMVLMFAVAAVHWLIRWMLCRRAVRADAALAEAHRDARDQFVVLSRNLERREQDRLLHDTILNTLTALARSGGTGAVIRQCRRDIAMLEHALSESGDTSVAGPLGTRPVAAIEAVVTETRARGLAVVLEVTGATPAEPGAVPEGAVADPARGIQAPGSVPGHVVAALAHATRQALANVAAHAGTGRAWVTVSMPPPGAAARLQVTIRDAGAGFDPGRVDPSRLGVRRSITGRVEDWGGSAVVRSAPGQGTVVCLSWPATGTGSVAPGLQAAGDGARQVQGQC